jgi:hypothetical protein
MIEQLDKKFIQYLTRQVSEYIQIKNNRVLSLKKH